MLLLALHQRCCCPRAPAAAAFWRECEHFCRAADAVSRAAFPAGAAGLPGQAEGAMPTSICRYICVSPAYDHIRSKTCTMRALIPAENTRYQRCVAGVSQLHASGIVHRDLKPGNVLLTAAAAEMTALRKANGPTLVLCDMGLSKRAGTGMYISPRRQSLLPCITDMMHAHCALSLSQRKKQANSPTSCRCQAWTTSAR